MDTRINNITFTFVTKDKQEFTDILLKLIDFKFNGLNNISFDVAINECINNIYIEHFTKYEITITTNPLLHECIINYLES